MCPNVVDEWKGCENFRARWNDRAMQCKWQMEAEQRQIHCRELWCTTGWSVPVDLALRWASLKARSVSEIQFSEVYVYEYITATLTVLGFFCIMHILKYAGGLCLRSRSLCTSPSSITAVITNVLDSCEDISQAYLSHAESETKIIRGRACKHA